MQVFYALKVHTSTRISTQREDKECAAMPQRKHAQTEQLAQSQSDGALNAVAIISANDFMTVIT